jgi:hypothetical protein
MRMLSLTKRNKEDEVKASRPTKDPKLSVNGYVCVSADGLC